jgi:hypothetical protein
MDTSIVKQNQQQEKTTSEKKKHTPKVGRNYKEITNT